MKLQGLSLSLCIRELAEDRVPVECVSVIHCGFDWRGSVPEEYFDWYWRSWPRPEIEAILSKIEICSRATGNRNIARGHWMIGEVTAQRLEDPSDRIGTEEAAVLAKILVGDRPRFKHDCPACIFLGHYQHRDLYYCDAEPTVVARRSNTPYDYASGLSFADRPLPIVDPDSNRAALRLAWLLARGKDIVSRDPDKRIFWPNEPRL